MEVVIEYFSSGLIFGIPSISFLRLRPWLVQQCTISKQLHVMKSQRWNYSNQID